MKRQLRGRWLGRRRYRPVLEMQLDLHRRRQEGRIGDTVLFVEHEPVVTLGRGAHESNVLVPRPELERRGFDVFETGRGGDVTMHAPGQLVCYPILDLAPDRCDVRRYVSDLTETMRRLARDWNVEGGPVDRMVGFWVDRACPTRWEGPRSAVDLAKLGAIGVRISRWVTMHGFAFNVSTDLSLFDVIVPCGISDLGVTSLRELTGRTPDLRGVAERALTCLGDVLGADVGEIVDCC